MAWGPESRARGVIGSTLVFAEWELSENGALLREEEAWGFKGSMMVHVDGERIKENTLYWMKDGEIVEVTDEEA